MFVLGLLVLAAAAVAGVELVLANHGTYTLHMWNWTWHFDAFWLAVMGAAIITAAWIGLGAMRAGFTHTRRIARERRELAAENAALAKRARSAEGRPIVEDNRRRWGHPAPAAPATAAPAPATPASTTATSASGAPVAGGQQPASSR